MRNQSLYRTGVGVLFVAMLVTACAWPNFFLGNGEEQPSDATGISGEGAVVDYTSLVDNLRASGATVEPADEVSQAFFSVTGQLIKVNGEDVQVFEYADETAANDEAALVSPDGGSIGTSMVSWIATPHFYKSGRVIVLYVGDNAEILGLLDSALGPQFAGG